MSNAGTGTQTELKNAQNNFTSLMKEVREKINEGQVAAEKSMQCLQSAKKKQAKADEEYGKILNFLSPMNIEVRVRKESGINSERIVAKFDRKVFDGRVFVGGYKLDGTAHTLTIGFFPHEIVSALMGHKGATYLTFKSDEMEIMRTEEDGVEVSTIAEILKTVIEKLGYAQPMIVQK